MSGGLLVALALVGWIGIRGFQAKGELESAIPLAERAQQAIVEGQPENALALARELARHGANAASLTGDPVWRLGEFIPGLGPNLETMRAISSAVDRVASGAVVPLAEAAGSLSLESFRPRDGRLDLLPLLDIQAPVRGASVAIGSARDLLTGDRVATAAVVPPLAQARDELTTMVQATSDLIDALDRAATLLPAMLGADGGRDILLLFQNNAELRSTGGIPGALALLHADGGRFDLVQQANSADFRRFDPPVVQLPVETRALWGENTARYIQDVNFTPQFPLAASIAREMWKQEFGLAPSTVVALDPVVLSYLLRATGPVSLPTGEELTSENAVPLLLKDVYERYQEASDQDRFFAGAAAAVLDAVAGGELDPRSLVSALVDAGNEHRVLIWSADPAEQAIIEETTLAGMLPVSEAGVQRFGVYLNDMTMSKMDTYLDVRIAGGTRVCRHDGLPTYEIEVTLTNTAPADAATSLPAYVTGGKAASVPAGNIATSVHVYSAPGTFNMGVMQDGQPAAYSPTTEAGYTISKVTANLAPGESVSWRFTFLGDVAEKRNVVIQSTPMIYKSEVTGLALSCD